MAGPAFVLRDYAGGVVEGVQLTAQIGSSDTSFTIANTTGWVNAANQPLGTVGPFTVVIDLGTKTVEKILCSAVNLTSGLVTVYTSAGFSGRGYDQSTPQGHVPGGSAVGVVPAWSAVEASEANQAVFQLLGGGSAPGSVGGRCYAASGVTVGGAVQLVNLTTQDYVKGGMTFQTTAGNTGLVMPVTGSYLITGQMKVTNAQATNITTVLTKNSGGTILAYGDAPPASGAFFQSSVATDIREMTAGDVLNLAYQTTATSLSFQIDPNNSSCFLAAALMAAG